jgi:hypothetical protein
MSDFPVHGARGQPRRSCAFRTPRVRIRQRYSIGSPPFTQAARPAARPAHRCHRESQPIRCPRGPAARTPAGHSTATFTLSGSPSPDGRSAGSIPGITVSYAENSSRFRKNRIGRPCVEMRNELTPPSHDRWFPTPVSIGFTRHGVARRDTDRPRGNAGTARRRASPAPAPPTRPAGERAPP